jgi:hypothetical protein
MKICFLVPDGTGIRNYLYSRLLSELPEGTEIVIWHNISENAIDRVRQLHPQIKFQSERIPVYVERFKERILREATTYARLRWSARKMDNDTIVSNWYKPRKTLKRKLLYTGARWLGEWIKGDYRRIQRFEARYKRYITEADVLAPYLPFYERQKPDIVFCTHQRIQWLVPAIEAARKLGIKTVTAIYSWDNIPKARLPIRTDKYMAWSDYMKEEMHAFYPEIPKKDIVVTGSPQFEFYAERHRICPRTVFARRYGLDPAKRWICYSGDDTDISPYDPAYLADVAEAVVQMEDSVRPQIIFRRCPADFTDRYDTVLQKYKQIITSIDPEWHSDGGLEWNDFFPLPSDVDLLVNLAYHCDLALNIASTVAHDFATFNKPACYINYDQPFSSAWTVKVVYRFQHFRSMADLKAVEWINTKEEIALKIRAALSDPDSVSPDRLVWLRRILSADFELASSKIAKLFISLTDEAPAKKLALEGLRLPLL